MEVDQIITELEHFYSNDSNLKESQSHSIAHAKKVHYHAIRAINCIKPPLPLITSREIELASLLHDVDDRKYFPKKDEEGTKTKTDLIEMENLISRYSNAYKMLSSNNIIIISQESVYRVLYMIKLVSCSENGNSIPPEILKDSSYHLLIPRWADRIEAVGAIGVIRCYQYTKENDRPLSNHILSPKAKTAQEVWKYATPARFEKYCNSSDGGSDSDDMISHYYDKLLHIAKPPKNIVRNQYLEKAAGDSVRELIEVCVGYGRTGVVDEEYIRSLERDFCDLKNPLLQGH